MHNTSSQLYKYISALIVDFFKAQKIAAGDRYNLYLENEKHVAGLYQMLKEESGLETIDFAYTHPEGGNTEYKSFCLRVNGTDVLLASSENASEDYFTMLRNQIAEQKDVFDGKAILILFSGKLDSLLGGSGSLIKEGMPLHHQNFKEKLEEEINQSTAFAKFEKEILLETLDRKTNSVVEDNNSIFDYQQVISCVVSEELRTEDYNRLGLFPHSELPTISTEKDRIDAIQNNFDRYSQFQNIHLHGNPDTYFERLVTEQGKRQLVGEDWGSCDFSAVNRWIEAKRNVNPPELQSVNGEDAFRKIFWKPNGTSATGRRTNNIIIFNPQREYPYEVDLRFDKSTQTAGIQCKEEKLDVSSSGHSLKVLVKEFIESETFHKITYTDKESSKNYNFRIIELPWDKNVLSSFQTNFQINNSGQILLEEASHLIFNPEAQVESESVLESSKDFPLDENHQLDIKVDGDAIAHEDLVPFSITMNEVTQGFAIKPVSEPPKIISGLDVWREKREYGKDFKYTYEEEVLKLQIGANDHTVRSEYRKNLLLEKQIIESGAISWKEESDNVLTDVDLDLPQALVDSFNNLREYYLQKKNLPSLVLLDGEAKDLAEQYLNAYLNELNSIQDNRPLNAQQRNLIRVGTIYQKIREGLIKITPLHPLNIAYQLYLNDKLKNEKVYDAILKRLNPKNLVPFLEGANGKIYTPIDSEDSPEWTYYTEYLESEQSVPKSYVKKLIREKIEDFTQNFDFLFSQSALSPIKINVINLGDCKEVVQGIFDYYRLYLNHKKNKNKRPQDLLTIDINIYGSDHLVTTFEELTYYDHVEEIEDKLKVDLKPNNFEKEDLLNSFLEKINFYSKPFPKEKEPFEYAHITFYQFDRTKIKPDSNKVDDIKTGVSLNGLMADVPSVPIVDFYRSGFGTKHMPAERSSLTTFACSYNALARVANNTTNFERSKAICTTINLDVKKDLENLYTNSQWVTYIDPRVDLDFFKEKDDLVIIHYSDQYNNSSSYDAITVSNKTTQYADIVKEFLEKNNVQHNGTEDTLQVINFFNAINGDWLLKLIRQDNQFPREKISLLSGIKLSLAFMNHPNITWIPVSLEEILRISGSAGLKQTEGLFSARNLGSKEFSFSDDLLMIGIEKCGDRLRMHLYPMELKIGQSNLIAKGITQGRKTAALLRKHVLKDGFLGEFYKNFFGKLAIINAEKMKLYGIWKNQNWEQIYKDYRGYLLNNEFDISLSLDESIGKFGLIHFGTNAFGRKLRREHDYSLAELYESDGYNFLVKSIDDLIQLFHETETGIDRKDLLVQKAPNGTCELPEPHFDPDEEVGETAFVPSPESEREVQPDSTTSEKQVIPNVPTLEVESEVDTEIEEDVHEEETRVDISGEGIEVLFGTNIKDGKEVIWEPNNTDKVMHTNTGIIGTMGTGKTQFTKSLISQLVWNSKNNVGDEPLGILIFDYKGDYIKDDFVKAVDAEVFEPYHLSYNPLALDATPSSKPMLPLHTANDLKETISKAFGLGNVQKQKLRDVIVEAYEAKGIYKGKRDTWILPAPTMGDVCNIYMSDENVAQDSLYAAISNLQDFEIFEPDSSKTKSLYSLINGVTVINLSGYDESIQNLIVAITLDAFYTQMQTHGHSSIEGNMRQLRKMILVDEADNFLSKNFNSIKKILKEGREFGVGTVLSTQFLNHFSTGENDYSNYILTWVIHRVNEIKTKEVESLFTIESRDQRDNLMKTIKGLEKHHSIVNLAGSEPLLVKDKAFWELTK